MIVKISEITAITNRLREINSVNLSDIIFVDDSGNTIEIEKEYIDEFKFIGLNNVDFITSEFYKKG